MKVKNLSLKSDARGSVCEPLEETQLRNQRNVHVVITQPGQVRGNHYHQQAEETAAVYGPALVRIREDGRVQDFEVPLGSVWQFAFPAGMPHAIQNLGSGPGLLVAFSSRPHDPDRPDTVKDLLLSGTI